MGKQGKTAAKPSDQTIEELQGRYKDLHTRKIQAERDLQHAQQQLDSLKKEAQEKYGSDDLAELRVKLDAMKTENEQKRKSYQAQLDQIDADLAAVEEKFAPVDAAPNGDEEGP